MRRVLMFVLLLVGCWLLPPGSAVVAAPAALMRPPLAGALQVSAPFQAPPNRYGAGHRGVDLAASDGSVVLAPAAGVVVYAGRLVDRGVVSIEHADGVRSSFEPVVAAVAAGQRVAAGAEVGVVAPGHARCAPASCLHWGVRINGEYVDPMLLLAPLRVRLLPWAGGP